MQIIKLHIKLRILIQNKGKMHNFFYLDLPLACAFLSSDFLLSFIWVCCFCVVGLTSFLGCGSYIINKAGKNVTCTENDAASELDVM